LFRGQPVLDDYVARSDKFGEFGFSVRFFLNFNDAEIWSVPICDRQYATVFEQIFTASGFFELLSRTTPDAVAGHPASSIIPGSQLPGVPLHRANVLVAYANKKLSAAADALFVSGNGQTYLPSHVETMAGVSYQLRDGQLSLSVQNPFGAYGGALTSPRYALAQPLTSGTFLPLAQPLHQVWSLRYRVQTGR
jgi:hypothetical protein